MTGYDILIIDFWSRPLVILVCYLQTLERIHLWCELNQAQHSSEHCQEQEANHYNTWVLLKRDRHPVLVIQMLWFFPLKSISHLLFWYPITLGLQPPRPTTSEVGGPLSLRCSAAADSTTEMDSWLSPFQAIAPREITTLQMAQIDIKKRYFW